MTGETPVPSIVVNPGGVQSNKDCMFEDESLTIVVFAILIAIIILLLVAVVVQLFLLWRRRKTDYDLKKVS